jgi:NSS family neurotransmitter:Na+ symporter
MGAIVTLVDVAIAFLAGLLIIPAVYVAQTFGAEIFDASGALLSGPGMIFQVLPVLFDSMGVVGPIVAIAFFSLMTIAAITSSIGMLEPAVCLLTEVKGWSRTHATWFIGGVISILSLVIVAKMDVLFGFVLTLTTKYSQPVLGMMFCIFLGWIWNRNQVLAELSQGHKDIERSLFWKIWPFYVKWFCPLFIFSAFVQKLLTS